MSVIVVMKVDSSDKKIIELVNKALCEYPEELLNWKKKLIAWRLEKKECSKEGKPSPPAPILENRTFVDYSIKVALCEDCVYLRFGSYYKVSKKTLENYLNEILDQHAMASKEFDKDSLKTFCEGLNRLIQRFTVFKRVIGPWCYSNRIIKRGPYSFYPNNSRLISFIKQLKTRSELPLPRGDFDSIWISVEVECVDVQTAEELSRPLFVNAENILNFHGNFKEGERTIGICDFKNYTSGDNIIIGEHSASKRYNFDDSYVADLKYLLNDPVIKKLLEISTLPKEYPKRVLTAANWIGSAIKGGKNSMGFVSCIIAIEALLQADQGLITPSIGSQVREGAAFILGRNFNNRMRIHRIMNRLYGLRSSAVHGGDSEIGDLDFENALSISKELVSKFLLDSHLKKISSTEEYTDYIKKKRYTT